MANKIDTVVWDADNNLWDWINMHLAGMRAMAKKISQITKASEADVKGSMARVYEEATTFDHKPLVQEMDIVEEWAKSFKTEREKIRHVIDLAFTVHSAYTHSRYETFKMYPDVPDVLAKLKNADVRNVILSDAPISKIIRRTKRFDIDGYFDLMCGQPNSKAAKKKSNGETSLKHYERIRRETGAYDVDADVVILPDRKPNIDLATILKKSSDEVMDTVLVVGDNFGKDVATADRNNCYGALGRHGASDIDSISGLSEFAPPSVVTRNAAGIDLSKDNLEMIRRMGPKLFVIDGVREVLKIVLGDGNGLESEGIK